MCGTVCRMRSGSSPALRQSHSTRRVLLSKSCTEQSQYHQSRTGRCTSHRCRRLCRCCSRCSRSRGCRQNTRIRARRRRSHRRRRGDDTCLSRWNLERENVESESVLLERENVSSQMTTEVRSQSSRFREGTRKTGFRGRRRRSNSHLRRRNTCLSRFVPLCQACADDADGADGGCAACGCAACADDADGADGVDGGCVMTTEFRNPSSRCRGCSCRNTRRRVLHHRNHHQRRSRRCLSIVTTPEVRNPCSPCPRRSRSIRLPRRRRRKGCRRHSRTCSCIVPACRSAGGGTEGLHERWPRACSDPPSLALRVGRAKISSTAAPQLSYRQKNCFSVSENIFQVLLKSQFVSQLPRFITEQATLPICGPPERLRFP